MDSFKGRRIKPARKKGDKNTKPQVILWKGAKLLRRHSIKIPVNEMLSLISQLDVVKINIIGNPSTGKSTLAMTLAHMLHKHAEIKFAVKVLSRKDLSNFKDIIQNLNTNVNWILVFDDISFLSANLSKKEIENIQKEFTEIRHLSNGKDIKVFCLFNFHYTMGVSKYLRQSDFSFYTSVGKSDFDNVVKTFGKTSVKNLKMFTTMHGMAYSPLHKFNYTLSSTKKITYKTREPFAPILFFNSYQSNIFVFPHRNWIDENCIVCDNAQKPTDDAKKADIKLLDEQMQTKFGPRLIKQAIRIQMFINGINTYDARLQRALDFIDRWSKENHVNLKDIAEFYGLEEKKAQLHIPKELFEKTKDERVEKEINSEDKK